jgi:hypothetical protein
MAALPNNLVKATATATAKMNGANVFPTSSHAVEGSVEVRTDILPPIGGSLATGLAAIGGTHRLLYMKNTRGGRLNWGVENSLSMSLGAGDSLLAVGKSPLFDSLFNIMANLAPSNVNSNDDEQSEFQGLQIIQEG